MELLKILNRPGPVGIADVAKAKDNRPPAKPSNITESLVSHYIGDVKRRRGCTDRQA